ncbi:MAG: cell division protein FtsQ/DivIB [Acidimicrobiales bacterium]
MKRLRIVLGLTLVSTAAIGVIGFLNSSMFDVDEITVAGNDRSDPQLIVDSSGIEIGQALLELDLDAAAEQVQLVPWVGTVEVAREWNGAITISVTERGPSMVLNAGPRFALVDDHGRQLEIVDARPAGYMPVLGIEGSGVAGEPAPAEALPVIALLEALPPEVEEQVGELVVEDGQLFLQLAVGGRANFGDGSDLGAKLQSFETMLARVDLSCVDMIDVRVPAAPVIRRTAGAVVGSEDPSETPATERVGAATEGEQNEEPDSAVQVC